MTFETRLEAQLKLFQSEARNLEHTQKAIKELFYNFLGGIQNKQIKSLKSFKEKFEEKEGFTPESLDFKAVVELITKFEIQEFNLIDNYNSSQKTLLEVTN